MFAKVTLGLVSVDVIHLFASGQDHECAEDLQLCSERAVTPRQRITLGECKFFRPVAMQTQRDGTMHGCMSTGQHLWSCTDFSLAFRRLRVAQLSFENRAGELQQSVTSEMKIASVDARAGRTGRLIGTCSGSGSRESPTRHVHRRASNLIKCAPTHQEVKRWKENARRPVHCEDVRTMETAVVVCVFLFNRSFRRKLTTCLVVLCNEPFEMSSTKRVLSV